MHITKTFAIGAAFAMVVAGLTGCAGSSNNNNGGGIFGNQAQVRSLNLLNNGNGGANGVSVNVGNTAISNSTTGSYGQFAPTSGYTHVTSGAFTASASGGGLSSAIQSTGSQTLTAGQRYTVVTAGQVGQTGTFAPTIFLVPEFNSVNQTIPSGDIALRVIDLTPSVTDANVFNTVGGSSAALGTNFSNVAYWNNTMSGDYTMVPVSTMGTLSVRSGADLTTDLALNSGSNLNNFIFHAGRAYTIYLYGQSGAGNQGLTAFVTQDWPPV